MDGALRLRNAPSRWEARIPNDAHRKSKTPIVWRIGVGTVGVGSFRSFASFAFTTRSWTRDGSIIVGFVAPETCARGSSVESAAEETSSSNRR